MVTSCVRREAALGIRLMARVAMGDEILDQRQGRRIEPLKVVDKNNQRVLWPREDDAE